MARPEDGAPCPLRNRFGGVGALPEQEYPRGRILGPARTPQLRSVAEILVDGCAGGGRRRLRRTVPSRQRGRAPVARCAPPPIQAIWPEPRPVSAETARAPPCSLLRRSAGIAMTGRTGSLPKTRAYRRRAAVAEGAAPPAEPLAADHHPTSRKPQSLKPGMGCTGIVTLVRVEHVTAVDGAAILGMILVHLCRQVRVPAHSCNAHMIGSSLKMARARAGVRRRRVGHRPCRRGCPRAGDFVGQEQPGGRSDLNDQLHVVPGQVMIHRIPRAQADGHAGSFTGHCSGHVGASMPRTAPLPTPCRARAVSVRA